MNFADRVFVRLADASTREAVFDQPALEQLAKAAYDADALGIEGPYSAVFDEFQAGFFAPRVGSLEGYWGAVGMPERTEAAFRLSGLGSPEPEVRIDAYWKGAIVARVTTSVSRIETVSSVLAATEDTADRKLDLQVQFAAPITEQAAASVLPIAVVLLIREAEFSVAQLVADSKAVRERLALLGLERRTDPALAPRHASVVAWVVPEIVFDDTDWGAASGTPAQQRAQRRASTGQWLAREGIGLVTTS